MSSYAESVYWAQYSSNCSMPTSAPPAAPPNIAEMQYWATYNSNCAFPTPAPETAATSAVVAEASSPVREVARELAARQTSQTTHIPHTVPVPTPHEIPTGIMTVKEFIHNLWVSIKNMAADHLPTGVVGSKTIEVKNLKTPGK
jgi:hypothetical protein